MKQRTIEETYQKKTPLQHVLLRPDTYVGSIQEEKSRKWVLAEDGLQFELRQIKFVPALYKIFDEILVNAADNYHRDRNMSRLDVVIDQTQGFISVENNGKGIPVEIHKEEKIYVPELIFGHLLTGSNYNDDEKKVVGGRNGYGAKLANIFSLKFIVECGDEAKRKKFKMVWRNNMYDHGEPEITDHKQRDFTKITFYPDFKRFNMDSFDVDTLALLKKRVFDMAGIIPKVKVSLNGNKINIDSFLKYIDMYYSPDSKIPKIRDKEVDNDRWQVVVSFSGGEFRQVSFVNSICTTKGGTHVSYILDQIITRIQEKIKKRDKNLNVTPALIKNHLWIFVNCLVENPTFDSQTKETMTLKVSKFGSSCELSEKIIKEILNSGVVDDIFNAAKVQAMSKLAKATAGTKKVRLLDVPKLEDANQAGTKNSEKCTLILTEGDSAKATAMSGLEVVGRDYFGVFPLRGKLLNVREAGIQKIKKNAQVQNIFKILGLRIDKKYENTKELRYGSIMIMCDQDTDGSHIKGLIINFVHFFWPGLYQISGFLKQFITPILKAKKGNEVQVFYTLQTYRAWLRTIANIKLWKIKYYKGLGTSTDAESKEYFDALDRHMIEFNYVDEQDDEAMKLIFCKSEANKRKDWLSDYKPEEGMEYDRNIIRYKEFVDREFIHFSNADNIRSICSIIDGFKPGQRKILYSCFKRNLKDEIKVAQLAGYVSEHSAYHHGQVSLCEAIVGMAQNFCGSNNINLLMPNGQFGSRHDGGKEHASARYIFTCLNRITRYIFPQPDDHSLTYIEDDGQFVEPEFYVPVIPMSLVNGCQGIGTGWSTNIPNFNPREIATMILNKLNNEEDFYQIMPWFKGYTGQMIQSGQNQMLLKGIFEVDRENSIIHIKELPVSKWIADYKEFLNKGMEDKRLPVEGYRQHHTKSKVHFELDITESFMEKYHDNMEHLEDVFRTTLKMSLNNMVAFDTQKKIVKYPNVMTVLNEFQKLRLEYYHKRKEYQLSRLNRDTTLLTMKERFITEVVEGTLIVSNRKKLVICEELKKRGYVPESGLPIVLSTKINKPNKKKEAQQSQDQQASDAEEAPESTRSLSQEYNYLLSLPIYNLTEQKIEEIKRQTRQKQNELQILQETSIKQLWRRDIIELIKVLDEVEKQQEDRILNDEKKIKKNNKNNKAKPKKEKVKKEKNVFNWDSDQETDQPAKNKSKQKRDSSGSDDGKPKKGKKSAQQLSTIKEGKPKSKGKKEKTQQTVKTSEKNTDQKVIQLDTQIESNDDFMQRIRERVSMRRQQLEDDNERETSFIAVKKNSKIKVDGVKGVSESDDEFVLKKVTKFSKKKKNVLDSDEESDFDPSKEDE